MITDWIHQLHNWNILAELWEGVWVAPVVFDLNTVPEVFDLTSWHDIGIKWAPHFFIILGSANGDGVSCLQNGRYIGSFITMPRLPCFRKSGFMDVFIEISQLIHNYPFIREVFRDWVSFQLGVILDPGVICIWCHHFYFIRKII